MTTGPAAAAFVNDDTIPGAALLYRRIPSKWIDWDTVDAEGHPRITRGAFQDYTDAKARSMRYPGPCMSVGLGPVLEQHGRDPSFLLDGWGSDYGIASVRVAVLRDT